MFKNWCQCQISWTDRKGIPTAGTIAAQYDIVFSKGDTDQGKTHLTEHEIPPIRGARQIRQPAMRLGTEKESEADKQITQLADGR